MGGSKRKATESRVVADGLGKVLGACIADPVVS
jgi:hypothetical protein